MLEELEAEAHEVHGAPHHPQSQGAVERANQTWKANLACATDNFEQPWCIKLGQVSEIQ